MKGCFCFNSSFDSRSYSNSYRGQGYNEAVRVFLLVLFSFTYGLEVSYKLSTRQLVFLLNPCHVISLLEIYLLAALPYADPNRYFNHRVKENQNQNKLEERRKERSKETKKQRNKE